MPGLISATRKIGRRTCDHASVETRSDPRTSRIKDARFNAGPSLSQNLSFHWLIRRVNVATGSAGLVKSVLAVYVGLHARLPRLDH
jgi:hypothetical protein